MEETDYLPLLWSNWSYLTRSTVPVRFPQVLHLSLTVTFLRKETGLPVPFDNLLKLISTWSYTEI